MPNIVVQSIYFYNTVGFRRNLFSISDFDVHCTWLPVWVTWCNVCFMIRMHQDSTIFTEDGFHATCSSWSPQMLSSHGKYRYYHYYWRGALAIHAPHLWLGEIGGYTPSILMLKSRGSLVYKLVRVWLSLWSALVCQPPFYWHLSAILESMLSELTDLGEVPGSPGFHIYSLLQAAWDIYF